MSLKQFSVKCGKNLGFTYEKIHFAVLIGILAGFLFFIISTCFGLFLYYSGVLDLDSEISNTDMVLVSIPNYWLIGFLLVISAVVEEIFFRGLMLRLIAEKYNYIFGIVITSLLFSLAHIGYNKAYTAIWALVFGFYLGFIMYKKKNIIIPMFTHITYNIIVLLTTI